MSTFSVEQPGLSMLSVAVTLLTGSLVIAGVSYLLLIGSKVAQNAPKVLQDPSEKFLIGPSDFWYKRWTFWKRAIASAKGNFMFKAGQYTAVGMVSSSAVAAHYDSKDLDFSAGFELLHGNKAMQYPMNVKADGTTLIMTGDQYFKKRLVSLLKRDYVKSLISPMVGDVQARLDELKGVINPFEEIYRVVWQLTMRTVGPHDVVEDRELLETTLKYTEVLDESKDILGLCYLWLPTPARIYQYYAGLRLYLIFNSIMSKRKKTGERRADALQVMIDQGDNPRIVIPTIIGSLFAGQFNSGLMSVWSLIHMAEQPELLQRARVEVAEACRQYDTDISGLPLDAWEKSFPFLDSVLRETIRLHMHGMSFRRNTSNNDVPIGNGEVVPKGAFAVLAIGHTSLNPDIYSNPHVFDPDRFSPERAEDKKVKYAFTGWGLGLHPCLGMKFAKMEMNMLLAFFVAKFDYQLVEADGTPTTRVPEIDNEAWAVHKVEDPVYFKLSERSA